MGGTSAKAKGLAQICWERRLIDDKPSKFTKTKLINLIKECHDFKSELSLVEWVAKQYGWMVMFSAKGHPEIAGVGIAYLWAVSKNWMQGIPLAERKGRERFDSCFKLCLTPADAAAYRIRIALAILHGAAALLLP